MSDCNLVPDWFEEGSDFNSVPNQQLEELLVVISPDVWTKTRKMLYFRVIEELIAREKSGVYIEEGGIVHHPV